MQGFVLIEINALSMLLAAGMSVHRSTAMVAVDSDDQKYRDALGVAIGMAAEAVKSSPIDWDVLEEIQTILKGNQMNSETFNSIPEDVLKGLRYAPRIDENVPTGMVREGTEDIPVAAWINANRKNRRAEAAQARKKNKRRG